MTRTMGSCLFGVELPDACSDVSKAARDMSSHLCSHADLSFHLWQRRPDRACDQYRRGATAKEWSSQFWLLHGGLQDVHL